MGSEIIVKSRAQAIRNFNVALSAIRRISCLQHIDAGSIDTNTCTNTYTYTNSCGWDNERRNIPMVLLLLLLLLLLLTSLLSLLGIS